MQNNKPGTTSLLNAMLMKWSASSEGTNEMANLAFPKGSTWVGIFRPCPLTVISRLPSPALLASTKQKNIQQL